MIMFVELKSKLGQMYAFYRRKRPCRKELPQIKSCKEKKKSRRIKQKIIYCYIHLFPHIMNDSVETH